MILPVTAFPSADVAVTLLRNTNQARGIGQYAIDMVSGRLGQGLAPEVLMRTHMFHTDAVLCGASALALGTNAPTILRAEALEYTDAPKPWNTPMPVAPPCSSPPTV